MKTAWREGSVLSLYRINLENNGKIPPEPDRENALAGANGGGDGSVFEPSPDRHDESIGDELGRHLRQPITRRENRSTTAAT